jgi:uncharacterized membrane protein YhaH (DUF805 family)
MPWTQYLWPTGRTNRAPYWVLNFLLNGFLTVLEKMMPNPSAAEAIGFVIVSLIVVYIAVCLMIGRFHDLDRTGWWSVLVGLAIVTLYVTGSYAELKDSIFRDYGMLAVAVVVVLAVVGFGGALYTGFTRGTAGPNRFGRDPLTAPIPA